MKNELLKHCDNIKKRLHVDVFQRQEVALLKYNNINNRVRDILKFPGLFNASSPRAKLLTYFQCINEQMNRVCRNQNSGQIEKLSLEKMDLAGKCFLVAFT